MFALKDLVSKSSLLFNRVHVSLLPFRIQVDSVTSAADFASSNPAIGIRISGDGDIPFINASTASTARGNEAFTIELKARGTEPARSIAASLVHFVDGIV